MSTWLNERKHSVHTPSTMSELDSPSMIAGTKTLLNRRRWKKPTLAAIEQAQSATRGDVGTNSPFAQGFVTINRSANRDSFPVKHPLLHGLLQQLLKDLHRLLGHHCRCGTQVDPRQASEALWAELLWESATPFVKLEQVAVVRRVFVRGQPHDRLAKGAQGSALHEAREDNQVRQATLPPRDGSLACLRVRNSGEVVLPQKTNRWKSECRHSSLHHLHLQHTGTESRNRTSTRGY